MKENKFATFSDQELLDKRKSLKTLLIINAVLIGILIGTSIYSYIKGGFSISIIFPLIFAFILIKTKNDSTEVEKEMKSRNL